MNSAYGNTSWQIFVYGTYAAVFILLSIYVSYSIYTRKTALKSLAEEGFLEDNASGTEGV